MVQVFLLKPPFSTQHFCQEMYRPLISVVLNREHQMTLVSRQFGKRFGVLRNRQSCTVGKGTKPENVQHTRVHHGEERPHQRSFTPTHEKMLTARGSEAYTHEHTEE